jgi:hypothetical protein
MFPIPWGPVSMIFRCAFGLLNLRSRTLHSLLSATGAVVSRSLKPPEGSALRNRGYSFGDWFGG